MQQTDALWRYLVCEIKEHDDTQYCRENYSHRPSALAGHAACALMTDSLGHLAVDSR